MSLEKNTPILQRRSLVVQVADVLLQDLRSGKWVGELPGENALAERLQVSRFTIRAALDMLRREGLISRVQGRPTLITAKARTLRQPASTRAIGFLSTEPLHALSPAILYRIAEMRRHLQDNGYHLDLHLGLQRRGPHLLANLARLIRHARADCWVLHLSTPEIQRWFMEHDVPTIVSGSCYEGIDLPFLEIDRRAVCRHAAGLFLGLGHRRVALLTVEDKAAGDIAGEQGFREGFEKSPHRDAEPIVRYHDGTMPGLRAALTSLMRSKSPPSGVLIARSMYVFAAMGHLMNAGYRIPRDVSVISRDDDSYLAFAEPSIARYRVNVRGFGRRLLRMVLQMATLGSVTPRQNWVMAQYCEGKSLGPYQPS